MSKVITVSYEVREEEVEEIITKRIEDPEIQKQIDELMKQRQQLQQQLREIDTKIEELQAKLVKQEVTKTKKTIIYIKCPICNTQIRLVGKQFKGRIRCKCGIILQVQ